MSLAMRHSSRPQRGLGIAVRLTREKKKLTQEAVAEQAGIAVPTLSHLEAGHANPTWATVSDVAAALGVTVAELAKAAAKHEP
jgi:transcriptional regulator with XRE-family HTH domain